MRLNRLLCVAALSMAALNAGAQAVAAPLDLNPYIQVKTVEGDEYIVRAFFSPACSYSREYFPFFVNLSKTLPAAFTPLVNQGRWDGLCDVVFGGEAVLSAIRAGFFVEASLKGTQDIGLSPQELGCHRSHGPSRAYSGVGSQAGE